jgi:type III secretion protein U
MAEDKPLPPSQKKLREARKKGQVPKSRDFVSAMVTLAAIGFVIMRADHAFDRFTALIAATGDLVGQPPAEALTEIHGQLVLAAMDVIAPLLGLVVAAAVMTSIVATGGLALSLSPLAPKPQKLNPAQGVQNLVSTRSLLDVLKSLLKLALIAAIATTSIRASFAPLVQLPSCGLICAAPVLRAALYALVGASAAVLLVFGLLDFGLQRWLFMRDQRMTHSEAKNEHKETEGNPEIRRAHARERREAAHLRAGLNEATFVIVGGRFAVAMRYSKVDTKVPIAVARAEADAALDLVHDARERKLPIVHDPNTARQVFLKTPIGKRIPRELYEPVVICMNQANDMNQTT